MEYTSERKHSSVARFASLIVAMVCAISFIFFGLILRENLSKTKQNVDAILLMVNRFVDEKLKAVDKDMQNLIQVDLRMRAFYIGNIKRNDYYELYLFYNGLASKVALDESLSSIYTYRKKDSLVIGTVYNHTSSLNEFEDAEYLIRVDEDYRKKTSPGSEIAPRDVHFSPIRMLEGQRVISINNCIPLYSNQYGWVIANVSVSTLKEYIQELLKDTNIQMSVTDAAGESLFKNTSEGRRYIESTVRSEYSGLVFNARQNFSFISYYAIQGHLFLIMIGAAVLAFCIYRMFVYVRFEIIPWNRVKQTLDKYSNTEPGTGIRTPNREKILDKLIEDNNKYPVLYKDWLFYKRRELIMRLLKDSGSIQAQELEEYERYNDISFINGPIIISVLRTEMSREEQERNGYYLQYLSKTISEYLGFLGSKCLVECISESEIVLIAEIQDTELSQLLVWFKGGPHFVSVAIGERIEGFRGISEEYKKLCELHEYRMALNNPLILRASLVNRLNIAHDFDIYEEAKALVSAITHFDEKWEAEFAKLSRMMDGARLKNDGIEKIITYILNSLKEGTASLGEEINREFEMNVYGAYQARMHSLRSLISVMEMLYYLLEGYMEKADGIRKKNEYYVMMDRIRHYIDEHIGDDQLSLQLISVHFDMNASVFSTVFKKLFGEKFIDYLIRVRIDKACEMLRDVSISVEIVSASVGYNNAASFSRAFKNKVGCSPSEYRRQVKDTVSDEKQAGKEE